MHRNCSVSHYPLTVLGHAVTPQVGNNALYTLQCSSVLSIMWLIKQAVAHADGS